MRTLNCSELPRLTLHAGKVRTDWSSFDKVVCSPCERGSVCQCGIFTGMVPVFDQILIKHLVVWYVWYGIPLILISDYCGCPHTTPYIYIWVPTPRRNPFTCVWIVLFVSAQHVDVTRV